MTKLPMLLLAIAFTTFGEPAIAQNKKPAKKGSGQSDQKWIHLDLSNATLMGNSLRIAPDKSICTKQSYSGPVDVTVIARTNKDNIRLHAFKGGIVIFNLENTSGDMRVHRPDDVEKESVGSVAVTTNAPLEAERWHTIYWKIREDGMEIIVNGKVVFSETHKYDLSKPCPIRISGALGSVVDVSHAKVVSLGARIAADKKRDDDKAERERKNAEIQEVLTKKENERLAAEKDRQAAAWKSLPSISGCYRLEQSKDLFYHPRNAPLLQLHGFFLEENNDVTFYTVWSAPEIAVSKVKEKIGRWEWDGKVLVLHPHNAQAFLKGNPRYRPDSNFLKATLRYVDDAKEAKSIDIGLQRIGPIPTANGPDGSLRYTVGELLTARDFLKKENSGKTVFITGSVAKVEKSRLDLTIHAGEISLVLLGGETEPNSFTINSKDNEVWKGLNVGELVTVRCRLHWEANSFLFQDAELYTSPATSSGSKNQSDNPKDKANPAPTEIKDQGGEKQREAKTWDHLDVTNAQQMDGYLRLTPESAIATKEGFTGPIEIVVVAKTERNNIRLHAFNGACVIFNWEVNQAELRVNRPDGNDNRESGSLAAVRVRPLEPNQWYTLRWRVTEIGTSISIDGKVVFSEQRSNNLSAKRPVIVASGDSVVDVKSLSVSRNQERAQVGQKPKKSPGKVEQPNTPPPTGNAKKKDVIGIGDLCPEFTLPDLDGKNHSLAEYKKDVVVVCVLRNSCPVSAVHEDKIVAFAKKYGEKIDFVAIYIKNYDDEMDKLPKIKEKGFGFPCLNDESKAFVRSIGAKKTPEFFVLNKDRRLIYRGVMVDSLQTPKQFYLDAAVEAGLKGQNPNTMEATRSSPNGCQIIYR